MTARGLACPLLPFLASSVTVFEPPANQLLSNRGFMMWRVALLLPAAVMVAFSLFCAFGVLATFEPAPHAIAWRCGYVAAGSGALYVALTLVRDARRRRPPPSRMNEPGNGMAH